MEISITTKYRQRIMQTSTHAMSSASSSTLSSANSADPSTAIQATLVLSDGGDPLLQPMPLGQSYSSLNPASYTFQSSDEYSSNHSSLTHRSETDRRRVRSGAGARKVGYPPSMNGSNSTRSTRTEESEEEAERKSRGGWSSINVPGQPYKSLGEPTLDFVFHVKRRHPSSSSSAAAADANLVAVNYEEKDGVLSWSKKPSLSSSPTNTTTNNSNNLNSNGSLGGSPILSNSLDLTDPVRDLLALCTPRRADVIDATAAIRERVTLSEARIRTVKAGGSFDSIDHLLKKKRDIQKFERARYDAHSSTSRQHGAIAPARVSSSPLHFFSSLCDTAPNINYQLDSNINHQATPATTTPGFDTYGSRLMHSSFICLSKLLNDGSVGVHSPPGRIVDFQLQRLGGPFRVNFEGNVFQNLPPHPLFEKKESNSLVGFDGTLSKRMSSLPSSNHQYNTGRIGTDPGIHTRTIDDAQHSNQLFMNSTRSRIDSSVRSRRKLVGCDTTAGSQTDRRTRTNINTNSDTIRTRTYSHFTHYSKPMTSISSLSARSPSSALSQIESSIHHTHAPPTSLSFHQLRYTLHQSFGTELHWKKEQESRSAALVMAKKKPQRLRATAAASGNLNQLSSDDVSHGQNVSANSNTSATEDAEIALINHPPPSSRFPQVLASRGLTGAAVGGVSMGTDREYVRAVAASKYRREHNNSPTSHWIRLQDNVQQRYAQAKALTNMAYFNPEGNLFQQGGLLVKEAAAAAATADAEAASPVLPSHSSVHSSVVNRNGLTFGMSPSRKGRSGPMSRTIHSGQILRQVSNTNWESFLQDEQQQQTQQQQQTHTPLALYQLYDDDGINRRRPDDSHMRRLPEQSSITKRAELTLARCYADFDLAKKDLKERLYEGLALMDSERDELVLHKYANFEPDFASAESDILRMRVAAEKKRYIVLQERLESLEKLYELVSFINYNNGGNNGDENSGLIGNTNGAALPTFEEIYLVEVLASLIDSGVPMCPHHRDNQVGEFAMPQDEIDSSPVKVGRFKDAAINGIHPTLFAIHANHIKQQSTDAPLIATGNEQQTIGVPPILPSTSSSLTSRRGSNLPIAGTVSAHTTHPHPHPHSLTAFSTSNHASPSIPAHTPPPSFLFLLLCLNPAVLKLKEVRESLDRWARLTGVSEESVENALRMVGVDPRLATYSGRGALKASNASGAGLSAAQLLMLNEGTLALDTDTKNALLKSAIDSVLPAAPVSRPLTTVVLTPVSLGEWEGRKRRERVKQSARDLERRVKAVRDLTVSSNAATRLSLNLTQPTATNVSTGAHLQGPQKPSITAAAAGPSTSQSVRVQPALASPAILPLRQSSSSPMSRPLSALPEEEVSVRGIPPKHRTEV